MLLQRSRRDVMRSDDGEHGPIRLNTFLNLLRFSLNPFSCLRLFWARRPRTLGKALLREVNSVSNLRYDGNAMLIVLPAPSFPVSGNGAQRFCILENRLKGLSCLSARCSWKKVDGPRFCFASKVERNEGGKQSSAKLSFLFRSSFGRNKQNRQESFRSCERRRPESARRPHQPKRQQRELETEPRAAVRPRETFLPPGKETFTTQIGVRKLFQKTHFARNNRGPQSAMLLLIIQI